MDWLLSISGCANSLLMKAIPAAFIHFSLQYPSFLFPGTTQYSSEPAPADIEIYSVINSIQPLNWVQIGNALRRIRPDIHCGAVLVAA